MHIALLTASPRTDGNSRALAAAFADGAADHTVTTVDLNTVTSGFLRDCRLCRDADGHCTIDDGYRDLVHDVLVPADAIVLATPLYFYGLPAVLKNVVDRLVCYLSAGYPRSAEVVAAMPGKRLALLLSSEEDNPALTTALRTQVQQLCRYLRQDFVAVVHGVGNRRGEVVADPRDPIAAARDLGRTLFDRHHTDYLLDTPRDTAVW